MTQEHQTEPADEFELEHFERNRYFQGKLMTAHDMSTEQKYHASRLETVTRLVTGTGIVSGLSIIDFDYEDGELHVTIGPGVAIDGDGRPIVVRTPTTRTIPTGDGNYVSLYITYDEESKDPVPVPGVEATDGEESQESRVLEIFELVATETPPNSRKTPPLVDLPDLDNADEYSTLADHIVDSYHEAHRERAASSANPGVFLGAFERLPDGEWQVDDDETKRHPFVYDNDMLFSLFLSLLVATDGAHGGDERRPGVEYLESELDQLGQFANQIQGLELDVSELRTAIDETEDTVRTEFQDALESTETELRTEIETAENDLYESIESTRAALRSDVEQLQDALQTQAELNAYQSLKMAIRCFDDAAATFDHQGAVSKLSLGVVEAAREAIAEEADRDAAEYRAFVSSVTDDLESLTGVLERAATDESYNQFARTVSSLEDVRTDDGSFVELVAAFDRVCQTATLLEPQYEIQPEG
ncbi:hypothetical protein EA462_14170 [Natrarchaeobius halalkaliphilus]|uniref:Uncharacterized protein n=1 Tax=Natrarchaeobius halalkaliphilus TaxID=1679091 RepID=A0A3N6M5I9_9EURY|nr:hypothetical protein [Natrarchaeobius halalkaliphilus]RQG87999.1 hypothetical protein EA462_14170 [Natrarchaeobius halalkaliphilus]